MQFKRLYVLAGVVLLGALGISSVNRVTNGRYFEILKNLEIFSALYMQLNSGYVDDLEPGKLMKTGIDAMMKSLDPYTVYYSESQIEEWRIAQEGEYHGVGAAFKAIDSLVTVTSLQAAQPAQKAGLKVGDQLVKVDGREIWGKTVEQVNELFRGSPGTDVKMLVKRPGIKKDVEITLTRGDVKEENVPYSGMLDNEIGYIVLSVFSQNAYKNVSTAYKELKQKNPGMKGVIFDLRGNGGGLLGEAVDICNTFVPSGQLIVSTKNKVKADDYEYKTRLAPIDDKMPLVVLIDDHSASASEIVSGTMQDLDRGVVVGQRSYGKGLVQRTLDLKYNARMKLTIAKYYTPSGRCIQSVAYENGKPVEVPENQRTPFKTTNGRTVYDGAGVKPDIAVQKDEERPIIKALESQNLIFNFVTEYCMGKDSIEQVEKLEFADFEAFMAFLEKRNFAFESNTDKQLKSMADAAQNDGLQLTNELATMKQNLLNAKKQAIRQEKEAILRIIEKDLASRYFYETGKIKMGLKNDAEIKEAVSVLKDNSRYATILKIKK